MGKKINLFQDKEYKKTVEKYGKRGYRYTEKAEDSDPDGIAIGPGHLEDAGRYFSYTFDDGRTVDSKGAKEGISLDDLRRLAKKLSGLASVPSFEHEYEARFEEMSDNPDLEDKREEPYANDTPTEFDDEEW